MGLNDNEVLASRKEYGSNEITKQKKNTFFKLLLESLGDPIIKILLIALAIKIVVLFRDFDWFETLGILIAIFLASFISSISEYGSEKAFSKLQTESSNSTVKVIRNGKILVTTVNDIVVGDIIKLGSGDKIPADGYIIRGKLSVDESTLNGEAKEVKKVACFTSKVDKKNKVFRGTIVYNGDADVKVTIVGDKTIYGKISQELQEKEPVSPLKERLRVLAKTISRIGYVGAILASLSYLFSVIVIDNNFDIDLILATLTNFKVMFNYLLYALTLTVTIIVVAVPEGLPMMITLVLSSNMKRMLKDKVLVRKLVGIETSGSLNVLLTDKTGTLTTGLLKVVSLNSYDGKVFKCINEIKKYPLYYELIYSSLFYNNECIYTENNLIGGNSTDKAIMKFVGKDNSIKKEIVFKILFDSSKKYSSVKFNNGFNFIKGASDVILPRCHKYITLDGKEKKLVNYHYIENKIRLYTNKRGRVIVLAYGKNFNDLTYLGFVNIEDEIRKDASKGVSLIKRAGVHLIMITGDAKETAISIASDVGLMAKNSIVLTSEELNKLSDEEICKKLFKITVIARALPQDKSRLVNIIETMNLVVGMTGDGVNDAPALKKANVGFAMGSGTDVAKEAADIIILDNSITSIGKAILYGRTIFKSIRRFIIYQLSVNMTALILSIVGSFIGVTTPITIVQMLWLNMIMDTFAGLAFSFEAPLDEYMDESPKNKNVRIINHYMYSEIIWTSCYSALLCILFLKLPIVKKLIRPDVNNKYLMTAYFALFIFLGIFNAFNARTERLNILANLYKNKVFIIIFTIIFGVQIYLIYYGGNLFRTYGLTYKELLLTLFLALSVFPVDFLRKYLLKKRKIKLKI